jgi:gliding motility-associated-like protein
MGGEITWQCQGGGTYLFDLVLYRDCNGFDVSTGNETIKVWNHPNVSDITVHFLSRQDISPTCTPVAGGPTPLLCGSGSGGGNGQGAVEKVIYRSDPINLLGNPPASAWVFSYSDFSRSAGLTNILNPTTVGITILAKMFNTNANGTCNDSSPQFLEVPFVVSCAGQAFLYNPNAYDPDLDSMAFSFGMPYNQIISSYSPPSDPANISFVSGYAYNNPTPDAGFNAANIPASINPQTGELSFSTVTTGNFAVKEIVQSFRNGVLVSEVQREIQIIVENCPVVNTAPIIVPPFTAGTSFDTTIYAGDLLNFHLSANDNGTLQDGSAQTVILTASGAEFGAGFSSTSTGCAIAPCAVLANTSNGSPIAQTDFSWQTNCNHLISPQGIIQTEVPYSFVFRFQDDLCQIPAVKYATVTVHVKNKGLVPEVPIDCIQVLPNGDLSLTYDTAHNVDNGFVAYSINSVQNGHLADIGTISTNTYTHVGANADNAARSYVIGVKSGCNGSTILYSDTVSSIFLTLNNPGNGTAILQWTAPDNYQHANWNDYYTIEMEYPSGTWTVIDSVPFGTNLYRDTITICSAFLNYRVSLKTTTCSFVSNIEGDNFVDQIPPYIPVIQSVSVDTATGNVTIIWNINNAPDTYGYVIYNQDANGFFVNLDTVWGRFTTSYTYNPIITRPLEFRVAAFDSCFTSQVPPTYQTTAKSGAHKFMYLLGSVNICEQNVELHWNDYEGWNVAQYEILGYKDGSPYTSFGTTNNHTIVVDVEAQKMYHFVVKASSSDGKYSFSTKLNLFVPSPTPPSLHYFADASVEDEQIQLTHYTNIIPGNGGLILERFNDEIADFEEIQRKEVTQTIELFTDDTADPNEKSYTYRMTVIDSCGKPSIHSNIAQTIFLKTQVENTQLLATLQWNAYQDWLGPVVRYEIYRGVDGTMGASPIAVLPAVVRTYVDHLDKMLETTGKFCYQIVAYEGADTLGLTMSSKSNISCITVEPLIYVPNAFTVGGENPVFLPVISLVDYNNYSFTIFDRWGQVVFRTNDVHQGWNGSMNGKILEESTYVYVIRLHDGDGNEITQRGNVTLLRVK